jgi:hypothetical protein
LHLLPHFTELNLTNTSSKINWAKVTAILGSKSIQGCKERLRNARKKVIDDEAFNEVSGVTSPVSTEEAVPSTKLNSTTRKPKRKAEGVEAPAEDDAQDTEVPVKKTRKARATKAKVNPNDGIKPNEEDNAKKEGNETTEATVADEEEATVPAKKVRKPRAPKAKKIEDGTAENDKAEDGTAAITAKKPRSRAPPKSRVTKKIAKAEKTGTEEVAASVEANENAAMTDHKSASLLETDPVIGEAVSDAALKADTNKMNDVDMTDVAEADLTEV